MEMARKMGRLRALSIHAVVNHFGHTVVKSKGKHEKMLNIFKNTCFIKLLYECLTCVFFLCYTSFVFAQNPVFRAGASTANITPYLGEGIAGGWIPLPLATNIHDEI